MYSTQLLEQSTSTLPCPPCCWNLDFFEYTLDIPHAKSAHEAPVRSSRSRSNHYWFENIAINLYRLFDGREDEHDHAGNHNKVKDHTSYAAASVCLFARLYRWEKLPYQRLTDLFLYPLETRPFWIRACLIATIHNFPLVSLP